MSDLPHSIDAELSAIETCQFAQTATDFADNIFGPATETDQLYTARVWCDRNGSYAKIGRSVVGQNGSGAASIYVVVFYPESAETLTETDTDCSVVWAMLGSIVSYTIDYCDLDVTVSHGLGRFTLDINGDVEVELVRTDTHQQNQQEPHSVLSLNDHFNLLDAVKRLTM